MIAVAGEVDLVTGPQLRECLAGVLTTTSDTYVVVDLRGVTFFGTSGLYALVRARGSALRGVDIDLLASPSVQRFLDMCSLSRLFGGEQPAGRTARDPAGHGSPLDQWPWW